MTTDVLGEGSSGGPNTGKLSPKRVKIGDRAVEIKTLGDYFRAIEEATTSINIASYVGIGNVWEAVMGDSFERPTAEQIGQMKQLVAEAMRDDGLVAFLRALMTEDVLPTLSAPPGLDLEGYIDTILHRFANPAIRHELAQIAWDGSQKLPFRLFGTIADALVAGRSVTRLCVPVAAWLHFIRDAVRDGRAIVDPLAAALAALAARCDGSDRDIAVWMELASVFPDGLRRSDAFLGALTAAYRAG